MTVQGDPLERCTARARTLVEDARHLASERTEPPSARHVLVALTGGGGVSQHVLAGNGIDRSTAGAATADLNTADESEQALLARAAAELAPLGHRYVGTEHLLLALTAVDAGAVPAALARLKLSPADLRREVYNLLGHDLENPDRPRSTSR